MTTPYRTTPPALQWGVAVATKPGQSVSGDMHLVKRFDNGFLIAVVDGLGHGEEARTVSRSALEILEQDPSDNVLALIQKCHFQLEASRGAVLSIASIRLDQNRLTWAGVGNVEGNLFRMTPEGRQHWSFISNNGIVGHTVCSMRPYEFLLARGDVLVITTDGIREEFWKNLQVQQAPQQVANQILEENFLGHDDALVLVVRYLGLAP